MSNGATKVLVSSEGYYHLNLALELALRYHTSGLRDGTVSHWSYNDHKMDFGWHEEMGGEKLPYKIGIKSIIPLVSGWLQTADYGPEPNIDGSCEKGWTLTNNIPYSRGSFYVSFRITPYWCEYHK